MEKNETIPPDFLSVRSGSRTGWTRKGDTSLCPLQEPSPSSLRKRRRSILDLLMILCAPAGTLFMCAWHYDLLVTAMDIGIGILILVILTFNILGRIFRKPFVSSQ